MASLMIITLLGVTLCTLINLLLMVISSKTKKATGGTSAFECGFDPMDNIRLPLSLRFFILIVLFLVFDVEIVLILPLILYDGLSYWFFIGLSTIFLILIAGLAYEWAEGSLKWLS